MGCNRAEQTCGAGPGARLVRWEREFFRLAATVLKCRLEDYNGHWDKFGCLLGEIDYGLEMHLVLREAVALNVGRGLKREPHRTHLRGPDKMKEQIMKEVRKYSPSTAGDNSRGWAIVTG
jgi:hypothetical protein